MAEEKPQHRQLVFALAEALGIKLEGQPAFLMPQIGETGSLKLPDGSLDVDLMNEKGSQYSQFTILIKGENNITVMIQDVSAEQADLPGAIYRVTCNLGGETYNFYLGQKGVNFDYRQR